MDRVACIGEQSFSDETEIFRGGIPPSPRALGPMFLALIRESLAAGYFSPKAWAALNPAGPCCNDYNKFQRCRKGGLAGGFWLLEPDDMSSSPVP
ncbi:hypothetical protein [Rhizobium laguerreae]|uniref:Uncharacterized protein n=1 Tax=Rhizobium laguerreae TaxID=1076926 RepID=A0A6N9ZRZ6_9HYPH|nr:hypothetical protein [Rhizobium laguerreae]NEH95695.1 hypothetical protein [Rhizobium laguerreae]